MGAVKFHQYKLTRLLSAIKIGASYTGISLKL
jgi:hypothetical protein